MRNFRIFYIPLYSELGISYQEIPKFAEQMDLQSIGVQGLLKLHLIPIIIEMIKR